MRDCRKASSLVDSGGKGGGRLYANTRDGHQDFASLRLSGDETQAAVHFLDLCDEFLADGQKRSDCLAKTRDVCGLADALEEGLSLPGAGTIAEGRAEAADHVVEPYPGFNKMASRGDHAAHPVSGR